MPLPPRPSAWPVPALLTLTLLTPTLRAQDTPPPPTPAAQAEEGSPEAPLVPPPPPAPAPAALVGRVTTVDGAPLANARVLTTGGAYETRSDADGAFRLVLPPGAWEVTILGPGFSPVTSPVQLAPGAEVTLMATLAAVGVKTEDYVIVAQANRGSTIALLDERRASPAVTEVLAAEAMTRAGDTNAASALRRVTGLTLVGGRYVYVRGLGERYSAALLNGSTLPSPEPERRVIPLDLFSPSTLESVTVQKTWSPDLPGEFGGGAVLLRTRALPEGPVRDVSLSAGFLSGATFSVADRGPAGPLDWTTFGAGARGLEGALADAAAAGPVVSGDAFSDAGYSDAELEAIGEAVAPRWALTSFRLPPTLGLNATAGGAREVQAGRVGALAQLSWSESWDHDTYTRSSYVLGAGGALEPEWRYTFDEVVGTSRLGGLLTMGADVGAGQSLRLTTTVTRTAENLGRTYTGTDPEDVQLRVTRTRWVEQQLALSQLEGAHDLPGDRGVHLDWRASFSRASRREPDRRDWRYDLEEGDLADPTDDVWLFSGLSDSNEIFYGGLVDRGQETGVDLTVPGHLGAREGTLKVGAVSALRAREAEGRRFHYQDKSSAGAGGLITDEVRALSMDALMVPTYIDPDGYQIQEVTRNTDSYRASQNLQAVYGLGDLQASEALRVTGGVRVERSAQAVVTYALFSSRPTEVAADLTTLDVLPSLSLTYDLPHAMQLRLGYGRTLSRPDFRELSPLEFNDVAGDFVIRGSPELDRVVVDNLDARWEMYPRSGESLSVAAFYKHFQDPIETVIFPGAEPVMTFQNALSAQNLGLELEARTYLDVLHAALADLYLAGNVSLIRSRITLDPAEKGIQTSTERPLQGQSPWVVNAQAGWDRHDAGTTVTVLYNVFGPRIAGVGTNGAPDLYEQPVHTLDLVVTQHLPRGFRLGLKGTNLLNDTVTRQQGGMDTLTLRPGWAAGVTVGWGG